MSNPNNVNELATLVGPKAASRLFAPQTFIKRNGDVGAGIKPQGAWSSVSVESALLILQNLEEFKTAAIEAAKKSKEPAERQRLLDAKNAKSATNSKAAPAKRATPAADELEAELAALG